MNIQHGMNGNTYNLLIKSLDKKVENINNEKIVADINIYTSLKEFISFKIIRKFIQIKRIRFNKKDNCYQYKINKNNSIRFNLASNYIDEMSMYEEELLSDERYGHCHLRAVELAPMLDNSNVIIGTSIVGSKQYLHSVVGYVKNNRKYIIDWTQNLVMKDEDYRSLYNFKEINSVDGKDIQEDIYSCNKLIGDAPLSVLLIFEKEICKDLVKSK